MIFNEKLSPERRQFIHALFIPTLICISFILVFIIEFGLDLDFHKAGIHPRDLNHIWGIFTYIFIHAGWGHLINNLLSFWVLVLSLYFFYKQIASKVLIFSYLISGVILWIIGRESWHIGASGLIYAIAFFLFFSGIIRKHIPLIAISLTVTFLYGSMIWHLFPWEINDPISWEGHLSGGISGLVLSFLYKNAGPQKPLKVWDEEEDEIDIEDDLNYEEINSDEENFDDKSLN